MCCTNVMVQTIIPNFAPAGNPAGAFIIFCIKFYKIPYTTPQTSSIHLLSWCLV